MRQIRLPRGPSITRQLRVGGLVGIIGRRLPEMIEKQAGADQRVAIDLRSERDHEAMIEEQPVEALLYTYPEQSRKSSESVFNMVLGAQNFPEALKSSRREGLGSSSGRGG